MRKSSKKSVGRISRKELFKRFRTCESLQPIVGEMELEDRFTKESYTLDETWRILGQIMMSLSWELP